MSGRFIKIVLLVSMVMLLSATSVFISKSPRSVETLSAQVYAPLLAEKPPAPLLQPFREFIQFMEHELDSTQTVGAAFTIVYKGEVVYTGTYGERQSGSHEMVDEHTLFRLASVSKGFAGVLASLVEEEGNFSLNDKVVDYYPGFSLKDSVSTNDLTIRNLLSHTSGLVPYAFDNLVEADQDLGTIIDRLQEVDISAPPGELCPIRFY
jgi:beta-lactamase class C